MKLPELDDQTVDRIVEMAWEDRTPFEAIEAQFNLPGEAGNCPDAALLKRFKF